MKPFLTIRKYLATVGIMPNRFHYRCYPFSRQCLIANSICIIGFISTSVYTFHVANNTKEYMDSLYVLVMACGIFLSYTTTVFNMNKWFCFFENFEKFFDESKCAETVKWIENCVKCNVIIVLETKSDENSRPQINEAKLNRTNALVEVLSKAIYFVIVIVGVSVIIAPEAIASFYNHFTTDSRNDAFELSLPVW